MLQILRPRQTVEPEFANAREHRCARIGFDPAAQCAFFEHQHTQALYPTRDDGARPRIPGNFVLLRDERTEMLLEQRALERRREVQLRFAFAGIDLGGDDEFTARQRRGTRQRRSAALAQQVPSALAAPRHANAVRVGERQQQTDGLVARELRLTLGARRAVAAQAPGKQFAGTPHLLQRPAIDCETRGCRSAAQDIHSMTQVGIALHALRAQRVALADEPRDIAGETGQAQRRAAFDHVCEPRVCAEAGHAASDCSGLPALVDCFEPTQQFPCLRQGRKWWRVEPGQRVRIARTPAGEFEREGREVGLEDFRSGLRRQRCVRGLGPQPIAHPRSGAPCPTATLGGRGAGNRNGLETAHAAARIEALPTLESCINDDSHPFDREAGFGEVRGDDDFAAPRWRGTQRRILCRSVEIAI